MGGNSTLDQRGVGLTETGHPASSAYLATVASLSPEGDIRVRLNSGGPAVLARLATPATRERLELAVTLCQQAVVVFEGGDSARPIVVGFIETIPPATPQPAQPAPAVDAEVDGRRVRVTAKDEIVLQCGNASVTLRRNGRVIIRGTYVETRSDGTNRIRGGQVQIN